MDIKLLSTPMDTQVHLTSEQAPSTPSEFAVMHNVPYCEAVGALNWAALAMRPDIAFAVATVAHFGANPGPAHWEAVKWIFRYLAGTRDLCLSYSKTRRILEGYADTDGSMAEDRQAISGYAFLIDGGAVCRDSLLYKGSEDDDELGSEVTGWAWNKRTRTKTMMIATRRRVKGSMIAVRLRL
jgi:hypothetical protein